MARRSLAPIKRDLKKLSSRHDAIMDLKLAQPELSQRQIAAKLGYTEAWVSIVVNSDSFQAMYRERYQEQFDKVVVPMRDRLNGLAVMAMERVAERLEDGEACQPRFALDTMNSTLRALGFADEKPGGIRGENVQVNNYHIADSSLLAEARERISQRGTQGVQVVAEIPRSGEATLGRSDTD